MTGDLIKTPQGSYRHLALEETTSTNTLCLEYAARNEPGGLWITAQRQIAGKGSRGREWTSEEGNLFASLLLRTPCEKGRLVDLTFIAAISVRETVAAFSHQGNQTKVKWPNDVLLNGRKCSGILLESVHYKETVCVAVGIGVNCQHFPGDTLHPATSLFAEGIEVSVDSFFKGLVKRVSDNIFLWDKGRGFSSIRKRWLDHAYGMGESVVIHVPGQETLKGVFASIDDNGYMLLELPDGKIRQISAADIFFNQAS